MSLFNTLRTASSGLTATQAGIALVGQNVANAQSVGYTRRVLAPTQQVVGDRVAGVDAGAVQRVFSKAVQTRLFAERSGAAYADLRADYARSLDRLFGRPGAAGSLDFSLNSFNTALGALAENPSDLALRASAISSAQGVAASLNALSQGVQDLRTSAERALATGAREATTLLSRLAELNGKLVGGSMAAPNATLEDERDRLLTDLSRLVGFERQDRPDGTIVLRTQSGVTLLDGVSAHKLVFEPRAALSPEILADDPDRSPGRLFVVSPSGARLDATSGVLRTGALYAHLEARDTTLVGVQAQLDELAAGLVRIFADEPVTPVSPAAGVWEVPLPQAATLGATALELVVGGRRFVASSPSALATALSSAFDPATVTVDGTGGVWRIEGLPSTVAPGSATWRATDVGGGLRAALFVDRSAGALADVVGATTGLAGRLALNGEIARDPALLSRGSGSPYALAAGDTRRVEELVGLLEGRALTFSARAMIGGAYVPFTATLGEFSRRIVESQGAAAESAAMLADGQAIALAGLEARFAEDAGVDIDREMAELVKLQTAYSANARVLTAVRELLDTLMRM